MTGLTNRMRKNMELDESSVENRLKILMGNISRVYIQNLWMVESDVDLQISGKGYYSGVRLRIPPL